jgi:hypothetical protein
MLTRGSEVALPIIFSFRAVPLIIASTCPIKCIPDAPVRIKAIGGHRYPVLIAEALEASSVVDTCSLYITVVDALFTFIYIGLTS